MMAATQKVSVTIETTELVWIQKRAKRLGGNLSAVSTEAARTLRQQEARQAVFKRLGKAAHVTHAIAAGIRAEWEA
jgi:hypothetical protein